MNKLRELRIKKGLTIKEASSILNISECYLSQLETGYRQLSRKMLINICNAYQVKPNEVLEYDNYVEIAENEYNEQEKVIDLINKKKV